MLEVLNLSHTYGSTRILHDVSFVVAEGEILGLLGPNGAGKSTTMRILTGYLRPSAGRVSFGGRDIQKEPMALRSRLGYMPENVPLYPELTVEEHLSWTARLKGARDARRDTSEVLDRCGLFEARNKLVRHLSKGYRQRVGLALAILGPTRLLILDEPTAGLDPQQIREIRALIRELGREKTILLSTHILPEVELTCDRVLIINEGRILAEDTPGGLASAFGGKGGYILRLDAPESHADAVIAALSRPAWVKAVEHAPQQHGAGAYIVATDNTADHRADIVRAATEAGYGVLEFKPAGAGLEDAFVNLVHREAAAAVGEEQGHTSEEAAA
ncbi:hypothetical protein DPQ33_08690 [Oceanidesulfovibrio indonesiensis]|uniref:ABC transporter domain-containing protein n=1 Tax=Oceanidesulfovibrio indonesiensis TaxID=54767 RepID=A0A7M3MGD6_9BACT|nr:ABC transporter ATP-binding protein [Oceanidesulfovibrio indonesiensis]TVM17704.1 hypothetical protein DPQ33_08690 [Oceanidesulfovibrio indonesiensis]